MFGLYEIRLIEVWFIKGLLYLDAELLLGTDVLGKAFQWIGKSDVMVWGNASYIVRHVK